MKVDWSVISLAAATGVVLVAVAHCEEGRTRSDADKAIACMNNGGEWVREWGWHNCKKPERR